MSDEAPAGWGWVGTSGASQYLRKSLNTLQKWRTNRVGPPWSKNGGHVMYKLSDLDQWLEDHKIHDTVEGDFENVVIIGDAGFSDAPGDEVEEDSRPRQQETAKKSDRWWEGQ